MSRFYLTLPSNSSMKYYPENTVARYTTKLDNTIELEGEWEVGMVEIWTPTDLVNVPVDRCYYTIYVNRKYHRRILLPPAHYRQINDLIDAIHSEQRGQVPIEGNKPLMVEFAVGGGGTFFKLDPSGLYGDIAVRFSSDLARILGFDEKIGYVKDTTAPHPISLNVVDIYSMYVYCDLLQHVVVGDTKAPLLRIVNKPARTFTRRHLHKIFNPILYVPLQKKNFDTVEINIMTDTGDPVPFRSGKSILVLEFRRTVHPYFAL